MSTSESLPTPEKCTADFCLIPMGTPSPSVSHLIAEIQRLIKKSGVKYTMHSAGTTLEGPWTQVTTVIGQCHTLLHKHHAVVRIQTDIRIGTRTDKPQTAQDKVDAVNRLLASDDNDNNKISDVAGKKIEDENPTGLQQSGLESAEQVGAPLAS